MKPKTKWEDARLYEPRLVKLLTSPNNTATKNKGDVEGEAETDNEGEEEEEEEEEDGEEP